MIELVLGIVRHGLTAAGGAMLNGSDLGTDIGNDDLSTIVGALVTIIGVAWSIYEKRRKRKAAAE